MIFRSLLILIAAPAAFAFTPTQDGLFAVFETTKGEFAVELYFEKVPVTVASFVGLASGTIPHYKGTSTTPSYQPFYNGLTFHRVVSNFVIQAGSPNGLGTDGPGYRFPDEIDATLKHDAIGMLSMANSGYNTNGSQFFITLSATSTSLNGKHAVFGKVVSGLPAVNAIGSSPVNASGKPTTNIVIETVTIIRQGAAANDFDEADFAPLFDPKLPELPTATSNRFGFPLHPSDGPSFEFLPSSLSTVILEESPNLKDWTVEKLRFGPEPADKITLTGLSDENPHQKFARVTEKRGRTFDMAGSTLTLVIGTGANTDTFKFILEPNFRGKYTLGATTASVLGYRWYPIGERTQFIVAPQGLYTLQCYLNWTSETGGTVYMHIVETGGSNQGTFTFEE